MDRRLITNRSHRSFHPVPQKYIIHSINTHTPTPTHTHIHTHTHTYIYIYIIFIRLCVILEVRLGLSVEWSFDIASLYFCHDFNFVRSSTYRLILCNICCLFRCRVLWDFSIDSEACYVLAANAIQTSKNCDFVNKLFGNKICVIRFHLLIKESEIS